MRNRWRAPPATGVDQEWKKLGYELDRLEPTIDSLVFESVFNSPANAPSGSFVSGFFTVRRGQAPLTLEVLEGLLSVEALGPPHGLSILQPAAPPDFPELPTLPSRPPTWAKGADNYIEARFNRVVEKLETKRLNFEKTAQSDAQMLIALASGYEAGEKTFVELFTSLGLVRHFLPQALYRPSDVRYDPDARVLLCEIEIPNFANIEVKKPRGGKKGWTAELVPVTASEHKRACELILYSLCIRAAYLVSASDAHDRYDTVAVNATQQWFDPATGAEKAGTVASLLCQKQELLTLQPGRLEAKACFKHLKGISTPSIDSVGVVRPILVFDTSDGRVVQGRDVAQNLDVAANLAAMPWDDFEHLVRQLLEWEFGNNGVEVKVTRASRDKGVDAIMYDPDPLRGGKFVVQAKRYTRTVDVSSVRDLYGTVMNEGANRGILVTTSGFGPDAYDFAKDKPISLVDGRQLLSMLHRHGREFRIDLEEARRQGVSSGNIES